MGSVVVWVPANDPCLQHAGAGMRGSPFHSEDLRYATRSIAGLVFSISYLWMKGR